jgi:hypothetical protein
MMKKTNNRIAIYGLAVAIGIGFCPNLYAGKGKWQQGTASIGPNKEQKTCPVGSSSTARAQGCTHDDCTTAKQQAAANLRGQYPDCGKYIRPVGTCLKGPECRS